VEIDAEGGGGFLESVVEEVAGNCEGGLGEQVVAEVIVSGKPRDAAVVLRVGERIGDAEGFKGFRRDTGDELAADAVARIAARLVERDGDAVFPESNGEGKAGESASGDGDRFAQAGEANTLPGTWYR
jgi:hypothetical protein